MRAIKHSQWTHPATDDVTHTTESRKLQKKRSVDQLKERTIVGVRTPAALRINVGGVYLVKLHPETLTNTYVPVYPCEQEDVPKPHYEVYIHDAYAKRCMQRLENPATTSSLSY